MNYSVVPLNGGKQFDLNGVRFSDKSFMFWKNKGNQSITEIVVVFDKKYGNMSVRDGVYVLYLEGLTSYRDLRDAFLIFLNIIQQQQLQFHFIIDNEQQRQVAEAFGKEFGISVVIQDMNVNKEVGQNNEQNLKKMEEEVKNQELVVGNAQTIEKNDNGQLKQITIDKDRGVAYENIGILSNEEEKVSLLREWMNDPIRAGELAKMSVEARNELLTQAVMSNRREYRLESANEVVASDKVGELVMNKASQEDGRGNPDLGVVQNNITNSNQFSAVEQRGDDVQMVNPSVQSLYISSSGISSNISYGAEGRESHDVKINEAEERMLGQGYGIDYSDNTLMENGEKIGYIGDYKDMGQAQSNVYSKPVVRTLKKQKRDISDKSAAFVSLPVIIFILSALLLIVSSVLLFIVD